MSAGTGLDDTSTGSAFTDATMISAEAARVGLVICRKCGAVLLLDPRDKADPRKVHQDWHDALAGAA